MDKSFLLKNPQATLLRGGVSLLSLEDIKMTSFLYFNAMEISMIPNSEEKTFRVEYKGKPFLFILSSKRTKKKKDVLEISPDLESKEYLECMSSSCFPLGVF